MSEDLEVDALCTPIPANAPTYPPLPQDFYKRLSQAIGETFKKEQTRCHCGTCAECTQHQSAIDERIKEHEAEVHRASRAPLGLDQNLYEDAFTELSFDDMNTEVESWEQFQEAALLILKASLQAESFEVSAQGKWFVRQPGRGVREVESSKFREKHAWALGRDDSGAPFEPGEYKLVEDEGGPRLVKRYLT